MEPIIPRGKTENPDGTVTWHLGYRDFKRVNEGYGCAVCLEAFAAWVPFCPSCHEPNIVDVDPRRARDVAPTV